MHGSSLYRVVKFVIENKTKEKTKQNITKLLGRIEMLTKWDTRALLSKKAKWKKHERAICE